jgi:hypothetical protein
MRDQMRSKCQYRHEEYGLQISTFNGVVEAGSLARLWRDVLALYQIFKCKSVL